LKTTLHKTFGKISSRHTGAARFAEPMGLSICHICNADATRVSSAARCSGSPSGMSVGRRQGGSAWTVPGSWRQPRHYTRVAYHHQPSTNGSLLVGSSQKGYRTSSPPTSAGKSPQPIALASTPRALTTLALANWEAALSGRRSRFGEEFTHGAGTTHKQPQGYRHCATQLPIYFPTHNTLRGSPVKVAHTKKTNSEWGGHQPASLPLFLGCRAHEPSARCAGLLSLSGRGRG